MRILGHECKGKVDVLEMKFLWMICGIRKIDGMRNYDMRESCGSEYGLIERRGCAEMLWAFSENEIAVQAQQQSFLGTEEIILCLPDSV